MTAKNNNITIKFEIGFRNVSRLPCSKFVKSMIVIQFCKIILNREGIIQPSRIGPDGKPVPVSHVLELIEDRDTTSAASSSSNPDKK